MSRHRWIIMCAVAVCAACGCRTRGAGVPERPERPRPVVELAGQSYAFHATSWSWVPPGPGADGRPGDIVLHNAFVRFVIAADNHDGLVRIAGNVIDAAVQGGEDRMRLLVPLIGDGPTPRPAYGSVRIEDPGGPAAPAVVVAEGHLTGRPDVGVTTRYTLKPGSRALEVVTTVRNGTDRMISLLGVGDAVYHGRTLRFVPDAGLMPVGRSSSSSWLCFFEGSLCWGVLAALPGSIEARHGVGCSELRYASVDIAPGASRSYERRLMAAVGGPEQVWQAAYPIPEGTKSHLAFRLEDRESGEPVAGGQIMLASAEGGSPVLLVTDCVGEAALDLPAGRYSVVVWAPGRPAEGPFPVGCAAGCAHVQPVTLAPRAGAAVRARRKVGGFVVPTAARLAAYPVARADSPFPPPTPFPVDGWSGVVFADGVRPAWVPLAPAGPHVVGSCLVVASLGPLFRCAGEPVEAVCGRTADVALTVERAVDAGDYVSVDCRQHTQASPDCAVAPGERALANACEGLTAAVVSDPVWRTVLPGLRADGEAALIPGLRVRIEGVGAFSAYPLEAGAVAPADLGLLADAADAWECVERLREVLPEAVIQLDDPLDERSGYFALSGFDPQKQRTVPPEFCVDFDAVELLSDRGLAGVDRTLSYWFCLLNSGRRPALTGSSGARDLAGAAGGAARTFLHCPSGEAAPTAQEIAAALRGLRTTPNAVVSNGPFVEATVNGRPIGSVLAAEGPSVQMQIRVHAPLWMDVARVTIYRNGEVVQQFALEGGGTALRCDRLLELEAPHDCWFVARVEGTRPLPALYSAAADAPPAFAVTNPFWVDADGDGHVRIPPR